MDSWRLSKYLLLPQPGDSREQAAGEPRLFKDANHPMPPQLHQSSEQLTCGCAPVTFVMGQDLQTSSPPAQLTIRVHWGHRAWSRIRQSLFFPRPCRIKVLLFCTGWVSASPKPWCDGVGGGGTCYSRRSKGLPCAWTRRSHLYGSCSVRASPHPIPQHVGVLCQGNVIPGSDRGMSWLSPGVIPSPCRMQWSRRGGKISFRKEISIQSCCATKKG